MTALQGSPGGKGKRSERDLDSEGREEEEEPCTSQEENVAAGDDGDTSDGAPALKENQASTVMDGAM